VQYFTQYSFTARRVLNSIGGCEKNEQVQQEDLFKPQTVTFIFQHIFRIHLSIYHTCQQASECLMQKRCWLLATGCWPGRCSNVTTFSQPSAFSKLLTCIVGLVKHLSPYTRSDASQTEWHWRQVPLHRENE